MYNSVVLRDYVINWVHYISTIPQLLWLSNLAGWVKWNIRSVISLLQQGLWPAKLAKWWRTVRSFHPQSYTTLWTRGHVRPCDKLKTLSILPQCQWPPNLAGVLHKNRTSIHNVRKEFDKVVFQSHLKN